MACRFDTEFQFCIAGKFHLGVQSQPVIRLVTIHSPEIDRFAKTQLLGVASSTSQARSTDRFVEYPSEPPEPVGSPISVTAANFAQSGERFAR